MIVCRLFLFVNNIMSQYTHCRPKSMKAPVQLFGSTKSQTYFAGKAAFEDNPYRSLPDKDHPSKQYCDRSIRFYEEDQPRHTYDALP